MASTPEKKVKIKVRKYLDELGAYYSMPVTSGYGNSGAPDFLVCFKGRFIGIECKAGGNKPTPLQEKNLRDIERAGGCSLVIDETNVDFLKPTLYHGIRNLRKSNDNDEQT